MPTDYPNLVERYVKDVTSGRRTVGRLERLAVERHLHDRRTAKRRGFRWSQPHAEGILGFCRLARHWKGRWAGQPFEPEPWEAFILCELFAWLLPDGRRRYREALAEIAKKNGKTFLAAVVGLALLYLDAEQGAEVYCAATKRDQAKLVWRDAREIIRASPQLRPRARLWSNSITLPDINGTFQPLSADYNTADGLNPHGILNDELHRHKDRGLYDVLTTATGARTQPLALAITTAGDENPESLYAELHGYAVQVLEGVVENDRFFAYVATLDEGDDWRDPEVYAKANPNLGVSVMLEDLLEARDKAVGRPGEEAAFKRLRLNTRTTAANPWLSMEAWAACQVEIDWSEYEGRPCWAAIDLSSTTDLTAIGLVWPEEDGSITVRTWGYCPADTIAKHGHDDRAPYEAWAKAGYLTATPGNVVDYRYLQERLEELEVRYRFHEVGYDRAKAADVCVRLAAAGLPMVEVPQGPVMMTAPITRIEDWVTTRRLRHDGDPLLRWCVANAQVKDAGQGLRKLVKVSSRARIDAATAILTAVQRYLVTAGDEAGTSCYEDYYAEEGEEQTEPTRRVSRSCYDTYYDEEPQP